MYERKRPCSLRVAQRAEVLGFHDLWVTENTLDHVFCFDPVVVLTYAAAVTTTIRLGASVVVMAVHSPLMIAHQWACLDYAGNGLWSCEEDVYNPKKAAEVIQGWIAAGGKLAARERVKMQHL